MRLRQRPGSRALPMFAARWRVGAQSVCRRRGRQHREERLGRLYGQDGLPQRACTSADETHKMQAVCGWRYGRGCDSRQELGAGHVPALAEREMRPSSSACDSQEVIRLSSAAVVARSVGAGPKHLARNWLSGPRLRGVIFREEEADVGAPRAPGICFLAKYHACGTEFRQTLSVGRQFLATFGIDLSSRSARPRVVARSTAP